MRFASDDATLGKVAFCVAIGRAPATACTIHPRVRAVIDEGLGAAPTTHLGTQQNKGRAPAQ